MSNAKWERCKSIKRDTARLACYDALDDAVRKVVKQSESIRESEPVKRLESVDSEITASVAKLSKTPHGKLKLVLDNGQRWDQKDTKLFRIKVGDTVIVKRGMLGSFYLVKPESNSRIKVKRAK